MKQILVMMVAVVSLSVVTDEKLIADPIVEKEVRKKLEGKLTEADLGEITFLALIGTKTTDEGLKEVVKCVSPVASPI